MNVKEVIEGKTDLDTYQPVGPKSFCDRNSISEAPTPSEIVLPAKPRFLKRRLERGAIFLLLLVISVAAAKAGFNWWSAERWVESTDDAYVGGDVTVIAPRVAGIIGLVAVGDNQEVHAGDLLVKLDDRDYLASLAKATAAVAMQEAARTNLEANRRFQEALILQAEAVIKAAEAEVVRSRDDRARYVELLRTSAVSIQESQRSEAEFQTALAIRERSQAGCEAARRQLAVIETQKQELAAALVQAQAERELARLSLSYTELRAPVDGVVGNRSGRVGAYAAIGSQLLSIIPKRGLWIDANFKESQLAHIRPGCLVTVRVDSIPGKTAHGHVESLAPATGSQFSLLPPENATGNFTKIVQRLAVRIVLADDEPCEGQLRPGLSVTARVQTKGGMGE